MNKIHPTAIIDERVTLGANNTIGPFAVLSGPLTIGNNNWIGSHVVIGSPGQDTRNRYYDSSSAAIEIGDDNIIREHCAIQKPAYSDLTRVGNRVFVMHSVHIPHDAEIEDDVVLTPMVALGGISHVMRGANLALGVNVQQRVVIGPYSICAMGANVLKPIKPFSRYIPGKELSVNSYAIEKFGFSDYSDEIAGYVLDDIEPTSRTISEIVNLYDVAVLNSLARKGNR